MDKTLIRWTMDKTLIRYLKAEFVDDEFKSGGGSINEMLWVYQQIVKFDLSNVPS